MKPPIISDAEYAAYHKRMIRRAKVVMCRCCQTPMHTKVERIRHTCNFCAEAGQKCLVCGKTIPLACRTKLCRKHYKTQWQRAIRWLGSHPITKQKGKEGA